MVKARDITNERYGYLVVVRLFDRHPKKGSTWLCKCDCGNEKILSLGRLRGGTKSCGCLWKKVARTHNSSKTRLYGIWASMLSRCRNKNHIGYHNYGGRGIQVCDEWTKFENFQKWSLENGYSKELSIDRINNNAGYEPKNCRWATRKQQDVNKRIAVVTEIHGEKILLRDLSTKYGVDWRTLKKRLDKGMTGQELVESIERIRKI